MPEIPRTKFNSPWTVAVIEAALNDVSSAKGSSESLTAALNAMRADEAEDREALVELVDGGAKNRWKITIPTLPSGFTATVDTDGGLILNGTTGSSALTFATSTQFHAGETIVLSGCPSGGSDDSYRLDILRGANTNYCYGDPVIASDFTETAYPVRIRIAANYTCNNLKFYPMVCSLAAWKISQAYQPYRPSWQEMADNLETKVTMNNVYGFGTAIPSNSNLNDYKTPGVYRIESSTVAATISNIPTGAGAARIEVKGLNAADRYLQIYYTGDVIYQRRCNGSSWFSWYKFEGTAVT